MALKYAFGAVSAPVVALRYGFRQQLCRGTGVQLLPVEKVRRTYTL